MVCCNEEDGILNNCLTLKQGIILTVICICFTGVFCWILFMTIGNR